MTYVSFTGYLRYAGGFSASLSSAIASLVGAPRVLQAVGKDRIYPGVFFFAKGYTANNDPWRGYLLVFGVAMGFAMIASLNGVSVIASNFFLAAYALMNLSCFHSSITKAPRSRLYYSFIFSSSYPSSFLFLLLFLLSSSYSSSSFTSYSFFFHVSFNGSFSNLLLHCTLEILLCTNFVGHSHTSSSSSSWRPSYTWYNPWVSLFSVFLCVGIMFALSWYWALGTFAITITLGLYIFYRNPEANWGSSTQGQVREGWMKGWRQTGLPRGLGDQARKH